MLILSQNCCFIYYIIESSNYTPYSRTMDLIKGSNSSSSDLSRRDSLSLGRYILCLRLISLLFFTSSTKSKPASSCGIPELKPTLLSGPLSQKHPCMPHPLPSTTSSQGSGPVIFYLISIVGEISLSFSLASLAPPS